MYSNKQKHKWKILILTTSRADYGILRPLLRTMSKDDDIDLRLAVTGTHLSSEFGDTFQEIRADSFLVDVEIPILSKANTNSQTMSHIMGDVLGKFGDYFINHTPDFLVVLGDRYETFAVCVAATNACIPIVHLHGGETTEGLMDECFRHSITKMSYLHFTSTEAYRKRVIQMGEWPERVFNVGALGVENAIQVDCLDIVQLEEKLHFPISKKPYGVVTFHPVTLENEVEDTPLRELLEALAKRDDMNFLITKSNSDIGGHKYNQTIDSFVKEHSHCISFTSLGTVQYMSALKYAACVIGNSSSGLIEAPSFGIPTINIGNRQRGRIQAESVINCLAKCESILLALDIALTEQFRAKASTVKNPYGNGTTSQKICKVIKDVLTTKTINLEKSFFDILFEV